MHAWWGANERDNLPFDVEQVWSFCPSQAQFARLLLVATYISAPGQHHSHKKVRFVCMSTVNSAP